MRYELAITLEESITKRLAFERRERYEGQGGRAPSRGGYHRHQGTPPAPPSSLTFDCSPEGGEGRLTAAVVGARRRDAILLLEVYMWTTEHPSSRRNMILLDAIARIVA